MTRLSSRRRTLAVTGILAATTLAYGVASLPSASAASARADLGKGHPATVATRPIPSAKVPTGAQPFVKLYQQVVSPIFTDTAGTETFATVACPTGLKALGGGAVISSTSLAENLNSSAPSTDGKSWRVWVNNASAANGTFFAYATCAKAGLYQIVTGTAVANPNGTQTSATVTCPGTKVPLGGGGIISSSSTGSNLNTSIPLSNGWRVDANNNSGADTSVTAYVVCGKKPGKYTQVLGTPVTVNAGSQAGATATCPTGTVPFGGGAFSSSGSVLVDLNSTTPVSGGWQSYENNGSASASTVTPYAVCGKTA